MTDSAGLLGRWPLDEGADVAADLLARYAEPHRGYHNQRHLAEVLERIDLLADQLPFDTLCVELAAWFHDAIYDGEAAMEERSAQLAESALTPLGVLPAITAEVGRLVRLTATHRPTRRADGSFDQAGAALVDADLAILAAPAERYADYVAGVRAEYAALSEPEFNAGRASVLRTLMASPKLFHTAVGQQTWEEPARRNVVAELERLTR
ncbi:MAG: hypothetical protein WAW88_05935 [Nocardioides sp.]